jgi:hypothetical protein
MWQLWYSAQEDSPGEKLTDQLDASRIQKIAKLRRGAIRSRSYCIIGVVFCVVGAIELIYTAIRSYRLGVAGMGTVAAYFPAGAALLAAAVFCGRFAVRFHREARLPKPSQPEAPPDFSQLSDGTQRARNLEQIHLEEQEES